MSLTSHIKTAVFAVCCLFPFCIQAESLIPPQLKFKPILTNQIEKLGYINTIAQDSDGFLWIGAIQGLARYDGYEIRHYRADPDKAHTLPSNWIKDLVSTRDGTLWVVTHKGVCAWQPSLDGFKCLYPENQGNLFYYNFFEDSKGQLWFSTSSGMLLYRPEEKTWHKLPAIDTVLPPLASSEANFVADIEEQANGTIWIGSFNNGVLSYNPQTHRVRHYINEQEITSTSVRDLFVDSKNTLWVASLSGGLLKYDEARDKFVRIIHNTSEKSREVWSINEDANGLFWIGDGIGVHIYDPVYEEFATYTYVEGVEGGPGNFVSRKIFHDQSGGTWVGYFPSGVDRIDLLASQFLNYRHNPNDPSSLADGGVLATLEDEIGNIWVGCGFGLSYLDRKTGKFKTWQNEKENSNSLSGSTVLDIALDKKGFLWVGAWDRGLNRFDRKTETFTRFLEDPNNSKSLYGREPWALLADSKGQLWIGTEKGLNLYHPETESFTRYLPDLNGQQLNQLYIREIIEDDNGNFWLGTFNGLYLFDPENKKYLQHFAHDPGNENSLSLDQIVSVYEDTNKIIWLGTNGEGLNRLDPMTGDIQRFTESDGLPNLNISGITEDADNGLWLSTYQGLTRLDKNDFSFTTYTTDDGPIGNLYNRNSPSMLRNGELVFGSTRGLTIFDPIRLNRDSGAPRVAITKFSIFNKPVEPGPSAPITESILKAQQINLKHSHFIFSFEFVALDYAAPDENRFSYRLKGFEETWNNVGNKRDATYTNIDPGRYVLQVRAANNDGTWSDPPKEVAITIAPPWWDTPWAWGIYAAIVIGGLYRMIYVYRSKLEYERGKLEQERAIVRQLKEIDQMKDQINKELDRKVEERTEELRREHNQLVNTQRELKLLNAKLEEMSVTDLLTGLKNRRFLYQSISTDINHLHRIWASPKKIAEGIERLEGLTFVLLDIDHFKKINDRHGHTAGDSVLTQLSELLKENVRDSDFVIRWGGEEFVIVLRHLSRSAAFPIAERIYNSIKSHKATLNNDAIIDLRCSMGIVFYPFMPLKPTALNWEQALNLADQALYCAKHSGRDCWVSVEAPIEIEDSDRFSKDLINQGLNSEEVREKLIIRSSRKLKSLDWSK